MINIYKISNEQREILVSSVNPYIVFDPIKDANNSYLISENEFNLINSLEVCPSELVFIKSLTSSIYEPKTQKNPFE
ncbi:hypothetical protein UFOVP514_15 [uncultured Caudovirales phage]|uniref:Uncharacterized protein n=1 Tax=uncultured Caudovirales phage TaxID=2100421 RepID=A0A6J5MNC9_9CAUD|nr:hypothetical protein UFOVP514_15 [uncultured Caudovirales phage]